MRIEKNIKAKSSVKANYIFNIMYQGIAVLFPLVLTPYLSRSIGSKGIGEYSFYFSMTSDKSVS